MREVESFVEIDAPPERVWAALVDFGAYGAWNPYMRSVAGELREGARLQILLQPKGGRPRRFRPTIIRLDPGRQLRWMARLWLPRLLDGRHALRVEPDGDAGTQFFQHERFSGLLVGVVGGRIRETERGFRAMNLALKARAEGSTGPGAGRAGNPTSLRRR